MPRAGLFFVLALAAAPAFVFFGRQPQAPVTDRPIEVTGDGYVSSRACRSCHPGQYASWHDSFHRTMTQVAGPASVVARFDGRTLAHDGGSYRVARRGDEFWVETLAAGVGVTDAHAGAGPVARKVVLVTGSHRGQVYWFASGHGRELEAFAFAWRIPEAAWMPLDAIFLSPPGTKQPLENGRWNTNCAQCHATHSRPLLVGPDDLQTDAAELGIACEACHGPGAAHVRANRAPWRRYWLHLTGAADPTMVQPEHLPRERAAEVCGQCHSIHMFPDLATKTDWNLHGLRYRPGQDLEAAGRFLLRPEEAATRPVVSTLVAQNPHFLDQFFWPDGMVRVTGREYHSLTRTACFRKGELTCLSCHKLHRAPDDPRAPAEWADAQLKPGMRTNAACVGCHKTFGDDTSLAAHTHHAAGSSGSTCYNCHMPYTTYGLLKAIRSHEVSSPSVAVSRATGRPNACNGCHLDRTLAWAAARLESQWGVRAPADLTPDERAVAASVLWIVRGDAGQRALMAWSLGWQEALDASAPFDWAPMYLAQLLDDPYDAVRTVALRSLRRHPGYADFACDPQAPPAERTAATARALSMWTRAPRARRAHGEEVLIPTELALRLFAERDERPVHLSE